jgi:hypothetical protein
MSQPQQGGLHNKAGLREGASSVQLMVGMPAFTGTLTALHLPVGANNTNSLVPWVLNTTPLSPRPSLWSANDVTCQPCLQGS